VKICMTIEILLFDIEFAFRVWFSFDQTYGIDFKIVNTNKLLQIIFIVHFNDVYNTIKELLFIVIH
jgi:hypothetical protein